MTDDFSTELLYLPGKWSCHFGAMRTLLRQELPKTTQTIEVLNEMGEALIIQH